MLKQRTEPWICYDQHRGPFVVWFGAVWGTFCHLDDRGGNVKEQIIFPDFLIGLRGGHGQSTADGSVICLGKVYGL